MGRADEQILAETALAVLTPGQKKTWGEMLGRPFVPRIAERPAAARR
jgi:hypothetical protein